MPDDIEIALMRTGKWFRRRAYDLLLLAVLIGLVQWCWRALTGAP